MTNAGSDKTKLAQLKRQARTIIRGIVDQAYFQGIITKTESRNRQIKCQLVRVFIDSGEAYERYADQPDEEIDMLVSILEEIIK